MENNELTNGNAMHHAFLLQGYEFIDTIPLEGVTAYARGFRREANITAPRCIDQLFEHGHFEDLLLIPASTVSTDYTIPDTHFAFYVKYKRYDSKNSI